MRINHIQVFIELDVFMNFVYVTNLMKLDNRPTMVYFEGFNFPFLADKYLLKAYRRACTHI